MKIKKKKNGARKWRKCLIIKSSSGVFLIYKLSQGYSGTSDISGLIDFLRWNKYKRNEVIFANETSVFSTEEVEMVLKSLV